MNLGLEGKKAIVTGAGGAIGGAIARMLVEEGVEVAIWDISEDRARTQVEAMGRPGAFAVGCDSTNRESVRKALDRTLAQTGTVDILVNCAGGSRKETTTAPDLSFFDIAVEDMERVMALNYLGSVIPSQEIGRIFADREEGVILNISSIAGIVPVTRAISYSNGKSAANSFTQWLAVHMAKNYSPRIRVNALAPGFLLTEQNRFLLLDEKTGQPTERGKTVMGQVPMGRYGTPDEIAAMAVFMVSGRASFMTGAVVPVDGGITAFMGV